MTTDACIGQCIEQWPWYLVPNFWVNKFQWVKAVLRHFLRMFCYPVSDNRRKASAETCRHSRCKRSHVSAAYRFVHSLLSTKIICFLFSMHRCFAWMSVCVRVLVPLELVLQFVGAGIWTLLLWKSSQLLIPELSLQPLCTFLPFAIPKVWV